jgi:hypothetical protein
MNKPSYILAILFLAVSVGSSAQTATGTPDANFSIYKNKLKKSDENKSNEKKNIKPDFWIDRAELMMDIFDLHREYLVQGTQQIHVQLIYGEPNNKETFEKEGSQFEKWTYERVVIIMKDGLVDDFEEVEKIVEDPLPEALASLKKAEELDVDGKAAKKIKENYIALKAKLERQGIEKFFDEDFEGAHYDFATIYAINQNPKLEGVVDTTLAYYAGMAASRADMEKPSDEMKQASIKYYEVARANNYPEPDMYVFLKDKYLAIGDTAGGVKVLEDGMNKYPDNQAIIIELINYYLMNNKEEAALEYLKIAQEADPTNLSFIFAEGTLYDKTGDQDKALAAYNRCIEIDPNYFNAYYNVGVMYYNQAVELYKVADTIKTAKEYGEAKDAGDVVLAKSLPYMEKAHEIDPNEPSTLETLKTLYYRLQMNEKYEEVKTKIEGLAPAEKKSGI